MTTKKKTPAKKAAPKTSKKPASPASPAKKRAPKLSLEELQKAYRDVVGRDTTSDNRAYLT